MALRFIDGFDHYASADITKKWTTAEVTFTIDSTIKRFTGSSIVSTTNSSTSKLYKTIDAQATWIVGFAWMADSVSGGATIFSLRDAGSAQVEVWLNTSQKIEIRRNGTLLTSGNGTTTISTGTWYYIEFKCTIASSISAGTCVLKLNGATEITVATGQSTKNTANATADQIAIWNGGFGANYRYDDLYACDGTGGGQNDFLGDCRVETLYPTAAGTTTNWTPSASTNFSRVNEAAMDSDTTYVSTSTVGNIDSYTMADLSATPLSIIGVQVTNAVRKDDAGSYNVAPLLRSASTNFAGTAVAVASTYLFAYQNWVTDPGTSAAWTASGVNALEAGVKLVS